MALRMFYGHEDLFDRLESAFESGATDKLNSLVGLLFFE